MIKLLKIIPLVLAVCLLSGCAVTEEGVTPPVSSDFVSSESASSEPVSSEPVSSEPQTAPESVQFGDLLASMPEFGEEVRFYGYLDDTKYEDAADRLEGILDGYKHNISFVAYSLDGTRALGYNTRAEIFCACTVKAPYTLYCCLQMDKGVGSLDTEMIYEKKHYEPGTGDMQYSSFGTSFPLKTALDKSMRISDNVGYLMAVDYFGRDGYNEWISSLGCPSLKIKPTVWSLRAKSRELAVAWREIYKYFESDASHAEFLYNSCTNTAGNYGTAALDVDYSHKQGHNRSGDWLSYSDAGIVWKEGSPYIYAILTDAPGPSNYDAGVFADIMKIVHNELL